MSHTQPGLPHRHRDENGKIRKKHGNTLIGTLRKIYGQNFATGFSDQEKLCDVLKTLDENSLSQLVEDHEGEKLHAKIQNAS